MILFVSRGKVEKWGGRGSCLSFDTFLLSLSLNFQPDRSPPMILFQKMPSPEYSFKYVNFYSGDKTFVGQTEDCSVPGLRGGRQGFVSAHFQTKLRRETIMKQFYGEKSFLRVN